MKAIFVACNQSIYDEVLDIMNRMQMRGYTGWEELMGKAPLPSADATDRRWR